MDPARTILSSARVSALIALIVLTGVVAPTSAADIGKEFLPPEHWAYVALARFETLGLVELPSHKPYSRDDVIRYVTAVERAVGGGGLAPRDTFELDRLRREFTGPAVRDDAKARWDRSPLFVGDAPLYLEGDLDLVGEARDELQEARWGFYALSSPEVRLHFKDRMTYEVRYRLEYGPERGDRVRDAKPSPREKSFRGLTSLYERAYLVAAWPKVTLFFGRDYEDWGPAPNGNLLVSETAGSLDKLGARFRFKHVRFSTFHSVLSSSLERNLAAHRLEFRFWRLNLAVSETVVYVGRGLDPIYWLPFSSYYANQFNEADDDNTIWSIDTKYRVMRGLVLFADLLIDDFQFERGLAPDKVAFDVGAQSSIATPIAMNLSLKYRYVDIYTYTHEDSLNAHVGGTGDFAAGEPLLGADDGPDSDRLTATVAVYPVSSVTATFRMSHSRRGEGNDFRTHLPGDEIDPPFPSGVVEKTLSLGMGLLWELPGGSTAGVDLGLARISNLDHSPGVDDWRTSARVFARWDM